MAHHIQLTAKAGNDVGGIDISPELRDQLWPGVPDEQFVDAFRMWIRQRMFAVVLEALTENAAEQANQILDDGITIID